jgi:hypothetical protein
MKQAVALDEAKLAQLFIQLVPQAQKDQYQLIKGTIPVNLFAMLDTLVMIEKMDIQFPRKPKKLVEKPRNGKGKRKVSFKEDILPQKSKHSSKYCALCAKHGGAKATHNTGDYRKYEKDRVFKKNFKSQKGKSSVNKKINRQSFKTMENSLKKTMKTEFKKMKKGAHKSKKRKRNDLSELNSS